MAIWALCVPVLKLARSPALPQTPYARCHRVNNRVPRERVRLGPRTMARAALVVTVVAQLRHHQRVELARRRAHGDK